MDSSSSSSTTTQTSSSTLDFVPELPIEVAEMIFGFLNANDLIVCAKVSRRWRERVNQERVWRRALPFAHCFSQASCVTDCDGDVMEVCPTMRKYMTDKLAMKRLENKYLWDQFGLENRGTHLMTPLCVWIPRERSLDKGQIVKLSFPHQYKACTSSSEDTLFLACSEKNFIYLYSRQTSTSEEFHLQEILAIKNIKNPECVIRREGSKESVKEFTDKHMMEFYLIECGFIDGTGNERIIWVKNYYHPYSYKPVLPCDSFVVWNFSKSRMVVHESDTHLLNVKCGLEDGGLCVTFSTAIKCYDSEGRLTNTFNIPEGYTVTDSLVMKSFSVVFAVVYKISGGGIRNMQILEFRQNESSARVGLNIEIIAEKLLILAGGPAYPIAIIGPAYTPRGIARSDCRFSGPITKTKNGYIPILSPDGLYISLYIGLLSTSGVSTWHPCNIPCTKRSFRDVFQFVDTTTYLSVSSLEEDSTYRLYKVIICDGGSGKEVKLHLVARRRIINP